MVPENELTPAAVKNQTLLEYLQSEFEKKYADDVLAGDWGLGQTLVEFVKFSHELLSKNRPSQLSYVSGDSSNFQLHLQDGSLVSILPVAPEQQAAGYVDSSGAYRVI